jgi:DNA ligase 1
MIDLPAIRGEPPRARASRLLFRELAAAVTAIGRALDAGERSAIAAGLLGAIDDEADLLVAARWLASDRRFTPHPTVASTIPTRLYAALSGEEIDEPGSLEGELFGACRAMAGTALEAIRMLLVARARLGEPLVVSQELTVEQIVDALDELERAAGSEARLELLLELWQAMDPDEIVTLHQILGRGAIAAGVSDDVIAEAIARAFAQPLALVRHALAIDGDAGATALAARRSLLETTFVRPMQLIAPMRAIALERRVDESGAIRLDGIDDGEARGLLVEERLPGARVQLHVWPSDDDETTLVALLTPSGRDVAPALPSLTARLASVPGGTVIDGQLIVVDEEGTSLDAAALTRAAAKAEELDPSEPPVFVGFDLLVADGLSLLESPLEERRFRLEALAARSSLPITRVATVHDLDELERHYVETIARGGLGIVAKRRESSYEFGRRSGAWLKAPGEPESVLAVIRYAAAGAEGRSGPPGELTFGVWLGEGDEARLVNIGRAECELDDEELERLERRLRRLRGKRFGTNYEIEPRIVCELEYDAIKVSPRTDAGYTIRVACIRCVRWELGIDEASTVAAIEERHRRILHRRSLEDAIWVPGDEEN